MRNFTHVSYLLSVASVNASRVKQRTALCHFFLKKVDKHAGFNPLPVAVRIDANRMNTKVGRTWVAY
jgi:hypothetical protein